MDGIQTARVGASNGTWPMAPVIGGLLDPSMFNIAARARRRSAAVSNPLTNSPSVSGRPQSYASSSYGDLRAPSHNLQELRRQQAEFARTKGEIENRNWWLAVPALAPAAVVAGLEAGAMIAGDAFVDSEAVRRPLNFLEREPWRPEALRLRQPLTKAEKDAIRVAGRTKYARAYNLARGNTSYQVHHSEPLEWAHLKPKADPNRLSNLIGVPPRGHYVANKAWQQFFKSLEGRIPSQAEIMKAKLRIDPMIEEYIIRGGAPRPPKLPKK